MKCECCGQEFTPRTNGGRRQRYCSKECRRFAINAQTKKSQPRTTADKTAVCAICGKQFTRRDGKELFCSPECRNEAKLRWQRKHAKALPPKHCAACGKEFKPSSNQGKYCSPECRRKGYAKKTKVEVARGNAQNLTDKAVKRPTKTLDDWAREAFACGLDYGTYRALIDRGKSFEELKARYERRRPTS